MTDLIVVGAGPAGLTAALYAARAGKTVKIIDAEGIGGQIAKSPLVENYPGIAKMSGMSFADNLYEQVSSLGVEFELSAVLRIEKGENRTHIVVTEDGNFNARAVILATGAKHRLLNVPGEEEFQGRGISYCALCDGAFFKGRPVAVIGGGNTALTDAIYLSAIASEVTILHRRDEFRADESLMDRARSIPNILWLPNVNIKEFQGSGNLTAIRYTDKLDGYVDLLYETRKSKGMTPEKAREMLLNDPLVFGVMMVKANDADDTRKGKRNPFKRLLNLWCYDG